MHVPPLPPLLYVRTTMEMSLATCLCYPECIFNTVHLYIVLLCQIKSFICSFKLKRSLGQIITLQKKSKLLLCEAMKPVIIIIQTHFTSHTLSLLCCVKSLHPFWLPSGNQLVLVFDSGHMFAVGL